MSTEPRHLHLPLKIKYRFHCVAAVLLCGLVTLTGCRSSASYAKLEQQLRTKEAEVRQVEAQLAESEAKLVEQDQQLAAHRLPLSGSGTASQFAMVSQSEEFGVADSAAVPEEVLAAWGSVDALRIQKLVSGIQWDSGKPVLHVVLRPVDADGELRKVAGQLSVQARPISGAVDEEVLAEQTWTITESRDLWNKGFVSSGFHARIPIANEQAARTAKQLLVTATLRLSQDRTFNVSETLNLPQTAPMDSK